MALSLLETAEFFKRFPGEVDKAAQMSINQTASRGALKLARNEILANINFPKDYLQGDRLRVTKLAKPADLEAVVGARTVATSLARFADSSTTLGSRARVGVRVQVKRGQTVTLKKAWLVNLRNGNLGLAVRLKPGQSIDNKTGSTKWLVPGKVALLYGPSVDQVFRDVSEDIATPVGRMLADEFNRQLTRFIR